ncbi:MAG: hypothetical protein JWM51_1910 [Microbacteriaceae bacterium]|nr:hypothetical protein [Microbacteriaceae bacterium]
MRSELPSVRAVDEGRSVAFGRTQAGEMTPMSGCRGVTELERFAPGRNRPLREQPLQAPHSLEQGLVAERVREPQEPARTEGLARHHGDFGLLENEVGELE